MSPVETLTLLFSDLVDSTAIGVALDSAAAADLRTSLFSLHREEIERVGGRQVKSLGDGVMAVFPNAASGLQAAVGIQRRVDRLDRRFAMPIRVRIGMSAGDVEVVDDDYFGEPVVEAARLCAVADPGSILVVELVRLLAGRAVSYEFGEVRSLEVKGLPDPVPVCAVTWESVELDQIPLLWPSGTEAPGPFVGRGDELQRFAETLRAVEAGQSRTVALTGESGIGKSRTAEEFARLAFERGSLVLAGRAREELAVPFGPYLEALTNLVTHVDVEVLADHLATHGAELGRLIPELAARMGPLSVVPETDPETERYRLYRAVGGLLADAGSARPTVVVLDDLHYADRSTLQLTRFLAGEAISGLLILAVYRPSQLDSDSPLHDLRAEQVRAGRFVALDLDGLDGAGVTSLIEDQLGRSLEADHRQVADAIARETDGNPFFVSEVVRHLVEVGELQHEGDRRDVADVLTMSLPTTVVEVVRRRVQRLGEPVERMLSAAAVLGHEFDTLVLADVAGLDESDLLDGLEAATSAELVRALPSRTDTFTFAHAIVARTLHRDLSPPRLKRLHRRAAQALGTRGAMTPAELVADIAWHSYEGRDRATTGPAIDWAKRAAERAKVQLAPDEAARWYRRALEMAEEVDLDQNSQCSLLVLLGVAQRDAGSADYRDTLRRASSWARELGSAELMAEAALANFRGFWSTSGSVDEERVDELNAARRALGDDDSPATARILATTAVELGYGEDEQERVALADQALAMARRLDQPATLAYLLRSWDLVHRLPWYLEGRLAANAEHAALAAQLGDPVEQFWAVNAGSVVALEHGDADRFGELVPQVLPAAAATGQRLLEWIGGFVVVSGHILRADWDQAEALMERTHELGIECGQPDADAVHASHLFEIRRGQGRLDELVELLVAMVEAAPDIEAFRPALGVTYCDLDRPDGRDLFEQDVANGFARYRHNGLWLASMAMNAEIAAYFDHVEAAGVLYDTLLPWRDQVVWTGTSAGRSVAAALGRVATTLGRYDEADELVAQGLDVHRRLGAPGWTAESLVASARLALTRRALGDLERAGLALDEAGTLAEGVGAATITRQVASLRRAAVSR